VQTRPVDINFRLRERNFMLMAMPGWFQVLNLEGKEPKRAAYTDPVTRARLISELQPDGEHAQLTYMSNRVNNTVIRGTKLERNRHMVGRRLGDLAAERGVRAAEFMIDIALEEDLDTEFKTEGLSHTDAEVVGEMLANRLTLIGASDAGAHVQAFATNGDTGYLFSKFVRETGALDLAGAIRKTTFDAATAWGLRDRGLIREGYAADLVLFDPDAIDRGEEIGVEDLPGAGFRYIRRARGIDTVIVNGQLTYTAGGGYTAARVGDVVSPGSPRAV
jgi:N-acyl-D-amino-acid deacylase